MICRLMPKTRKLEGEHDGLAPNGEMKCDANDQVKVVRLLYRAGANTVQEHSFCLFVFDISLTVDGPRRTRLPIQSPAITFR